MHGALGLHGVTRPAPATLDVIACATTKQQVARLTDALKGFGNVTFVATFAHLRGVLRSNINPPDVVVLATHDLTGASATSSIAELNTHHAGVALVALCDPRSNPLVDIRALANAGVHQFVFWGIQDEGVALRSILMAARQQCACEIVGKELSAVIPSDLHSMVEAALGRPQEITTVSDLADALGLHRKTLFNRCLAAHFLMPAELLAWARIALVGYFLERTGCTLETISIELSFPSDTALRNLLKRYTGLRATDLRSRGALRGVLAALDSRIREHRMTQLHMV